MAITLVEGNKFSTTELDVAVIDELTKDSEILTTLPFEELVGNSLTYDRVATDATAEFYSPNEVWTENTMTLDQATVTLKILGGMIDLDNFILRTRSNKIDLKGQVTQNKVKAVKNKFIDTFWYGNATTNPKEFDGIQTLMTSTTYNTIHAGSDTGSALAISKLRELMDLPSGYAPAAMFMTKLMRRGIAKYLDSIGEKFPTDRSQWGKTVQMWDGVPIVPDDHITDTETASSGAFAASTGGGNTTIFLLSFAPQAVCGVQAGTGPVTEYVGPIPDKDGERYRIKWYPGLKFENLRSSAKLDGIDADGTVIP